jgi:nucleoid DNA-binding protein
MHFLLILHTFVRFFLSCGFLKIRLHKAPDTGKKIQERNAGKIKTDIIMVARTLVGLLESHRRVVLPGFGAFIRKQERGDVVLVGLLKADDGLIRLRLAESGACRAGEVERVVEKYVEKVKRGLAERGLFVIEGLGRLVAVTDGYRLEYDPDVKEEVDAAPEQSAPVEPVASVEPERQEREHGFAPFVAPATEQEPKSRTKPQSASEPSATVPPLLLSPPTRPPVLQQRKAVRPPQSGYRKPAEEKVVLERRTDAPECKRPENVILVVAIIAAMLAVGAMVYGILNDAPHRIPL